MKYPNRTSGAQKKFLLTLRDGTLTLPELKSQLKLKEAQFGRWMRNPFFYAELLAILKQSSKRRFVELELAASVAMVFLRERMGKQIPYHDVYLCKTLIELARNERTALQRRARGRKKRKKLVAHERPLCHPSVMNRRAESLAELKALA